MVVKFIVEVISNALLYILLDLTYLFMTLKSANVFYRVKGKRVRSRSVHYHFWTWVDEFNTIPSWYITLHDDSANTTFATIWWVLIHNF